MNRTAMLTAAIAAAGLLAPAIAPAHEAGDLIVRVGAHMVDRKSDNGSVAGGTLAVARPRGPATPRTSGLSRHCPGRPLPAAIPG